jgi:NAD(P)-dependent dehydrogenase (short-subunit alcohol dehydrogenase family)
MNTLTGMVALVTGASRGVGKAIVLGLEEAGRIQKVQNVTVHSAYHRGQVTRLLRQLGKAPLMTDCLIYIDAGGDFSRTQSTNGAS